jgi:hypothetical protein
MAPALAEADAAYAHAVALFDGNSADELALTRAQWNRVSPILRIGSNMK